MAPSRVVGHAQRPRVGQVVGQPVLVVGRLGVVAVVLALDGVVERVGPRWIRLDREGVGVDADGLVAEAGERDEVVAGGGGERSQEEHPVAR